MEKGFKLIMLFVVSVIILLAVGCGKGTNKSVANKTTIPECGFSMNLPFEWTIEDYAETEFYKRGDRNNCWGMAKFCPIWTFNRKFKGISEYLVEEDRFEGTLTEVISQKFLKIGEVQADAYEIIFKDTNGNYIFTIFIEMENKEALQVFFLVSGKEYEKFRKQYPAVVKSIHLAKKKAEWKK